MPPNSFSPLQHRVDPTNTQPAPAARTGNLILGISGELWEQADPSGTWPGIVQIKIPDTHPPSFCLWQQISAGWNSQHSTEVLSPVWVGKDGLCSHQSFWGLIVGLFFFFPTKKA